MKAEERQPRDRTVPPVVASSLRDEVVNVLRDTIWRGILQPGEHLNEMALAERLGVSRPPLREAIRTLEAEGLVVSRPRRGSYVRRLSGEDVLEIYSLRCALEGMAADLIIDANRSGVVDGLEEKLEELERETVTDSDLSDVIAIDLRFHRAFVAAAGNGRLLQMWERLVGELRLALSLVPAEFFSSGFVQLTHRPLLEALRAGDRARAHAMIKQLMIIGRSLHQRWSAIASPEESGGRGPDG